jgi:hypothetical protein
MEGRSTIAMEHQDADSFHKSMKIKSNIPHFVIPDLFRDPAGARPRAGR